MGTFQWIVCCFLNFVCVAQGVAVSKDQLVSMGKSLSVNVTMVDNLQHNEQSHTVRIWLKNNGSTVVPSQGWRLYWYSMYILYPTIFPKNTSVYLELEKVNVGMIQGDLYYLEPGDGFVEIKPGEEREYDVTVAWWSVSRTDFMPNWFLASTDQSIEPVVVLSTETYSLKHVTSFDDVRKWKRYAADRYNPYTPQERLRRLGVADIGNKIGKLIIPTPKEMAVIDGAKMSVDNTWKIFCSDQQFNSSAEYLRVFLDAGVATDIVDKVIVLFKLGNLTSESYILKIDPPSRIYLWSNDTAGMFYAAQSLRSILDGYDRTDIPTVIVQDAPRYAWRGMHLDVARNFHNLSDVKRLISVMAMYKMNKLHLHLSDDEGWRLEIPTIPELTGVGSNRCFDLSEQRCIIPQFGSGPFNSTSGSGFFSTEDYKDLLKFAASNHIQVVPEFDMPGHAHAAIASMEHRYTSYQAKGNTTEAEKYRLKDPLDESFYISVQQWMDNAVNPCMNSTYTFIGQIMDTLIELHKDIQPLEFYNFGGDEVATGAWEKSPACQMFIQNNPTYNLTKGLKMNFVERVAKLAGERNLKLAGWEDGFADGHHDPIEMSKLAVSDAYAIPWNNIWEWGGGAQAYRLANAGYKVILAQATNLYFDQPQEPDPEERGLYWATRFTDTYKVLKFMPDLLYENIYEERSGKLTTKHDVCGDDMSKCPELERPENIVGMQGQLWSETVRTSENVDYMIYPRLLALAERAWHKAEFETLTEGDREKKFAMEWEIFASTLGHKEFRRLDAMGVQYRVPPPGARVNVNGAVEVSPIYPGLGTQVSYNNGDSWVNITDELQWRNEDSKIHLRTVSADWKRFSRAVKLYKEEPIPWVDQHTVDYIAENIVVNVSVIDNLKKDTKDGTDYVRMRLSIRNSGNSDITVGSWRIYFYSLYGGRTEDLDCGLHIGHENGGLYYFSPSSRAFKGILAGKTISCEYNNKNWMVSRSDNMPNWYVTSLGMKPKILLSTQSETLDYVGQFRTPAQWKRQQDDRYDPFTPSVRYDMYSSYNKPARKPFKVIPTPTNVSIDESTSVKFSSKDWVIVNMSEFSFEATILAEKLGSRLVDVQPGTNFIAFRKDTLLESSTEGYLLNIEASRITVTAGTSSGAFYGAQTLLSLIEGNDGNLVKMTIRDKPRFQYRGVMPDTARNFKPKEWILQFIDAMAMYKLNKLHFHLTDDEAWRIEIPDIPELTKMGSSRCHSDYAGVCVLPQLGSGPYIDTSGSGYYTVKDYQDILKYANERHIVIIPEIELPGHSGASIATMDFRETQIEKMKRHKISNQSESYLLSSQTGMKVFSPQKWQGNAVDPCLNTTYRFIEKVIDALIKIHLPVQPLKLLHIGGDEVADGIWNDSAACKALFGYDKLTDTHTLQRYFVKRVATIVADKGLNLACWDDAVYSNDKPNPITDYSSDEVVAYPWDNRGVNTKRPSQFADEGYKVVLPLATHLYFDQAQGPDPEERGLYWATRYTDTEKAFALMPDNLYANIDVDRMGNPIDLRELCNNKACPVVTKPENIIGIEACMWAETMRTRDQFHYMGFPRLLALAERAWHKAAWENIDDKQQRNLKRKEDWEDFAISLGYKEFTRLEKHNISYRIPPPGARVVNGVLKANAKYENLEIQWKKSQHQNWETFQETRLSAGQQTYWLRAKSKSADIFSRAIEINTPTVSASVKTSYSVHIINIALLVYLSFYIYFRC